jgi:hypothetical protein
MQKEAIRRTTGKETGAAARQLKYLGAAYIEGSGVNRKS